MKRHGFRRNGFSVMASATDACRQRGGRAVDWIERIGGVMSGRAVATLALDADKVRCYALTHKSSRQLEPDRMTGQAIGFLVRLNRLERFEGTGVRGIPHFVVNFSVALGAGCGTSVLP